MSDFTYRYHNCSLVRVEDAGTYCIMVQLGFNCQRIVKFQHQEYDAPSFVNPDCIFEKELAKRAMDFVNSELKDKKFDIVSYKTEDTCIYLISITYVKNNVKTRLEQQLALNELSKSDVTCDKCVKHGECLLDTRNKKE